LIDFPQDGQGKRIDSFAFAAVIAGTFGWLSKEVMEAVSLLAGFASWPGISSDSTVSKIASVNLGRLTIRFA